MTVLRDVRYSLRILTRNPSYAMLFNVETRDPLTFAAVAMLLGVVAIVATALPAIRAVHVDPMLALRSG